MNGRRAEWYLRFAVVSCFLCHGIMAWRASAVLYSEWSVWIQRLVPTTAPAWSTYFLRSAGTLDILAAMALVLPKAAKAAFGWAIGWGFLTALARLYFIGMFTMPFWQNIGHPVAELLARTANWVVPVLLFKRQFGGGRFLDRLNEQVVVNVVVISSVSALLLNYFAEWNNDLYPVEVLRTGETLLFFHACGIVAALALAALAVRRPLTGPLQRWAHAGLPVLALLLPEAFSVMVLYWPRGLAFTVLQVGEHAPIYVCFAFLAQATVAQATCWQASSRRVARSA